MNTLYLDGTNEVTQEMLESLLKQMNEEGEVCVNVEYKHAHDGEHEHTHVEEHHMHVVYHDDTLKKTVLDRLSRAIGHLESVKRMVEDNRDANEVLVQLSAVESSIRSTSMVIIKDHFKFSIDNAVAHNGDKEYLTKVYGLVDKFLR